MRHESGRKAVTEERELPFSATRRTWSRRIPHQALCIHTRENDVVGESRHTESRCQSYRSDTEGTDTRGTVHASNTRTGASRHLIYRDLHNLSPAPTNSLPIHYSMAESQPNDFSSALRAHFSHYLGVLRSKIQIREYLARRAAEKDRRTAIYGSGLPRTHPILRTPSASSSWPPAYNPI